MIRKARRALRPYQREAYRWAGDAGHAALFLDMRLGKTLTTIRRCHAFRPRDPWMGFRGVVFAPGSALEGWESDLNAEGVAYTTLAGLTPQERAMAFRRAADPTAAPGWVLANKELWQTDVADEIASFPWDAVVADESHFLKNPAAQVTKWFLKRFRSVPHRYILTGTPCPEGEHEYVCQMLWLRGSFMGCETFWKWRMRFMRPDPRGFGWAVRPEAVPKIRKEVARAAFILRRSDAGLDVPKIRERRELVLPPKLRREYRRIEDEFEADTVDGELRTTQWSGEKYVWLRRAASGFDPDGNLQWPGKLNALRDLADGELARDRFVVWANFRAEIDAIASALGRRAAWADGRLSVADRKKTVAAWRRTRNGILVMQPAIGKTGMNLSAADTAIYFSLPPGLEAYQQTQDRIVLPGKNGVLLVFLLTKGTVDKDLYHALTGKRLRAGASFSEILREQFEQRRSRCRR